MNGIGLVTLAAVAFVGSHFALSHPLRRPLVSALGERGFMVLYSAVAAVTMGAMAWAYVAAPASSMLWPVGDGLWAVVTAIMLLASVLLMGSFRGNPAMPDPGGTARPPITARGVFAITRHPMMWSFALWGLCHILVYPLAANIVLCLAIIVLALAGSAMQDRKKARLAPDTWPGWQARTSFWPFAAIARGQARLHGLGGHALGGGLVVWLVASWAHIPLAGWPAGIWRWIMS